MQWSFEAELWMWDARRSDTWTFVTVPPVIGDEIREVPFPRAGFGSVRVEVTVGVTTWATSVFPDKTSGSYVLPIKKAVRCAEQLEAGDQVAVTLTLA